jgi:hypothetical protein
MNNQTEYFVSVNRLAAKEQTSTVPVNHLAVDEKTKKDVIIPASHLAVTAQENSTTTFPANHVAVGNQGKKKLRIMINPDRVSTREGGNNSKQSTSSNHLTLVKESSLIPTPLLVHSRVKMEAKMYDSIEEEMTRIHSDEVRHDITDSAGVTSHHDEASSCLTKDLSETTNHRQQVSQSLTLERNLLRILTTVNRQLCMYQHTLTVLEKAAEHSKLIEEMAMPPPVSRESLDEIINLIEKAYSHYLTKATSESEMASRHEMMQSTVDRLVIIDDMFDELDSGVWSSRGCIHTRIEKIETLSDAPDVPYSSHKPLNRNSRDLFDDLSYNMARSELSQAKNGATCELNLALMNLTRFSKARLDDEFDIISDSGYNRKPGYPFCLISNYELVQIKALLCKGFKAIAIREGSIPNLNRHKRFLLEANTTALGITHLFEATREKESPEVVRRITRQMIRLLLDAEDPAYLLVPDAPQLRIRKRIVQ